MPRQISMPCDELTAHYHSGASTIWLAQLYGCSPTTVAKHLRACGATVRRSRFQPSPVAEAELRRLYAEERLPLTAIAAHFGVSVSTIGNKRRCYGIPARPRRRCS